RMQIYDTITTLRHAQSVPATSKSAIHKTRRNKTCGATTRHSPLQSTARGNQRRPVLLPRSTRRLPRQEQDLTLHFQPGAQGSFARRIQTRRELPELRELPTATS